MSTPSPGSAHIPSDNPDVWTWFWFIQGVMFCAMVIGWPLLIIPCLLRCWILNATSIKDGRQIDTWSLSPLNPIYKNPEDGVSGQQALVWSKDDPPALVPYMPDAWPPWRAWKWSAWRNSCNNLQYVFARPGEGPYKEGTFKLLYVWDWTYQMGWKIKNSTWNVPVLSIKPTKNV